MAAEADPVGNGVSVGVAVGPVSSAATGASSAKAGPTASGPAISPKITAVKRKSFFFMGILYGDDRRAGPVAVLGFGEVRGSYGG